jgi:hypothetical protein
MYIIRQFAKLNANRNMEIKTQVNLMLMLQKEQKNNRMPN